MLLLRKSTSTGCEQVRLHQAFIESQFHSDEHTIKNDTGMKGGGDTLQLTVDPRSQLTSSFLPE